MHNVASWAAPEAAHSKAVALQTAAHSVMFTKAIAPALGQQEYFASLVCFINTSYFIKVSQS